MKNIANEKQVVFFDPRFIETYAGTHILGDPVTAIVELIANSWDAGATSVKISWPQDDLSGPLMVEDNGSGMSEEDFLKRWRTLAYNRLSEQGEFAEFPKGVDLPKRRAFGKNGVGRFAAFCFRNEYIVETWRGGEGIEYRVGKGEGGVPIVLNLVKKFKRAGHGTKIIVNKPQDLKKTKSQIRAEVGMRFLIDPSFQVSVSGENVTFFHIPQKNVVNHTIRVGEHEILLKIIDLKDTDRTTKQHGIAWHVNGRLVGECSWKGTEHESFIDGRRIEAKRYTFIVIANCLNDAVLKDWSGFDKGNALYLSINASVQKFIGEKLLEFTKEKRGEVFQSVTETYIKELKQMPLNSRQRWATFVQEAQEKCPSIREEDLVKLAGVLANMELSRSKFDLIHQLHLLNPTQIDSLNDVLNKWTVDYAKIVLDELEIRLKLLEELRLKVADNNTDEVHGLQPLFKQSLWMFGPEYETIEFTANEGMTAVIQKLFKSNGNGSRNRPDFAILPDSSIGCYSYPQYDINDGGEIGTARLVIVELKKPGITIGTDEKGQCWKYVKELYDKGLLNNQSSVDCFVLGTQLDPNEAHVRKEKDEAVRIRPMTYGVVVEKAKSRLLKLYDRVRNAPFLKDQKLDVFEDNKAWKQGELELQVK